MGHTYSQLLVHVIFSTKGRAPLIADNLRSPLHAYMGGIAREELGTALCVGGTENHVHGLLGLRTDISVASAMMKWKSLSSGWVNKLETRTNDSFAWQIGYAAFSVSQSNASRVIRYIERQIEHHRKQTFEEEYITFLKKHNIDYDPRYVWD